MQKFLPRLQICLEINFVEIFKSDVGMVRLPLPAWVDRANRHTAQEMLSGLDTDGDGTISFDELAAAIHNVQPAVHLVVLFERSKC